MISENQQVFIYPAADTAARKNFDRTVALGVPIDSIAGSIPSDVVTALRADSHDGLCHFWGFRRTEKLRKQWEKIRIGDLMLSFRDSQFTSSAYASFKVDSQELSNLVWKDAKGTVFPYIVFLRNVRPLAVPARAVSKYLASQYRGLSKTSRMTAIRSRFPTLDAFAAELARLGEGATNVSPEDGDDTDGTAKFQIDSSDHRATALRSIKVRRGQTKFRNALRERFGDACQISGCKILSLLEAAHIHAYRGDKDNHPSNGLLLRADLHTLFDLNLIAISPLDLRIEVHPEIESEYGQFAGVKLAYAAPNAPSAEALIARYREFQSTASVGATHCP